ncbi:hypothetical protein BKA64DRAFT_564855 [Cadophora sp. MPI-SDFR-AT-0126]|nr:hypothetical protein BKA64DRAFT_564855 [Leotiomycetes sp. MPI-SDFR-AT-0126]
MAQSQLSDTDFDSIFQKDASRHDQGVSVEVPLTPGPVSKGAIKKLGTSGRKIDNPLNPTSREEQILEKHEELTEKEQAKDLKTKTRVRVAKFILRGLNFSCSLIVLAMVSMTLSIFNATKTLAPRNNLSAWATGTNPWPQKVILAVSCVSSALCLVVFWNYFRGGHRKAEKVAVYHTLFAVAFFLFSVVMWCLSAGILQGAKSNSGNKDIWGWSCVDNTRRELFSEDVDYALVCRMQDWSLVCCIIQIVLESVTIILYGVVFYRYFSKQRLRKSMDVRDRARSDFYLAQLRSQSEPSACPPNPSAANEDGFSPGAKFVEATTASAIPVKSFARQPLPKFHGATPKTPQASFNDASPARKERVIKHVASAPGEQTYDAVPIPGAYASLQQPRERFGERRQGDHDL